MPQEHSEILKQLSLEGPLGVWQAVLLGVALAGMAYWTLFLVPRRARRTFAPLLMLLRTASIALVLWMLLGPVSITIKRQWLPKSLAVMTDVSQSMGTIDPVDKVSDLRWQIAGTDNPDESALSVCDQAAVAAAVARDNINAFLLCASNPAQQLEGQFLLESAERGAGRAVALTDVLSGMLEGNRGAFGDELIARVKDIAAGFSDARYERLGALARRARSDRRPFAPDEITQLQDWHRGLADAVRRVSRLSEQIAQVMTSTGAYKLRVGSDPAEPLARRDKVNRLLQAAERRWLSAENETSRIRRYTFDRATAAVTSDAAAAQKDANASDPVASADGRQPATKGNSEAFTNLSEALARINRDSSEVDIEAAIIFTDGKHNDPQAEDPRAVAKLLANIPVYFVAAGSTVFARDLNLHHVEAPSAVVDGDHVVVEAILSASGCAGESCMVALSEGGKLVDQEEIRIDSDFRDYRIRLSASARGIGRHDYALSVSQVDRETDPANNDAAFGVDVIDATLRILLADEFPRWEYRYLVNLFERDERIEYEQLLFQPKTKGSGDLVAGGQLPRDVEGWARYRAVILGDLSPDRLDQVSQKALTEYLTVRGGTLIVIAGQNAMPHSFINMPLGDVLPVSSTAWNNPGAGLELELTPEAQLIPAMQIGDDAGTSEKIWRDISRQLPLQWLSQYCVPKPTARTLIQAVDADGGRNAPADQKAFLCWQTVGRGRIVYLAAPAAYQLRMKHGDRFHYRFWGQLIRWAVARDLAQGSKTVKLTTDRSRASAGENVQIIANLSALDGRPVADASVQVDAAIDGNPLALVELKADPRIPGRYLGDLLLAGEGAVTFSAGGADVMELLKSEGLSDRVETTVIVDPVQSTETRDTRANIPLLSQIARITNGQVVHPDAVAQLVALTNLEPDVREETICAPLWNRWLVLAAVCGTLLVEWAVRKSTGLP